MTTTEDPTRKLRTEAAGYRVRLRAAEAELERLRGVEAERDQLRLELLDAYRAQR